MVRLFLFLSMANPEDDQKNNDPGFLYSLNLMVLGGVLLLFAIISLNKLLNHYFSSNLEMSRGILYSVNEMEPDTFKIYSSSELYLTWLAFSLSALGLIITVNRLVKTWSH